MRDAESLEHELYGSESYVTDHIANTAELVDEIQVVYHLSQ